MFLYHDQAPLIFTDPLPASTDVVVIGGGVIGVSTAWFLRQRGLSVLVCDKGRVAGEQSSRNWGWVRSFGRDPDEVPIAMESTNIWEGLQQELGDGIGFRREAVLALADNEKELAEYEAWLEVAREYGLDTRMLSPSELDQHVKLDSGTWLGGAITPSDGRAEPFSAVKTLAEGLQARGGLIREACAVRTVEQEAGKVSAVVTELGTVKTRAVVLAGGAWSTLFLSNLGISLPQLAVKGTVARTAAAPEVFEGAAGLGDIFIRRRNDGGYTVATGMAEHNIGANSFRYLFKFIPAMAVGSDIRARLGRDATQQSFPIKRWSGEDTTAFESCRVLNPEPSRRALDLMRQRLAKRVPLLAEIPFEESWAGMIDATADVVPVMDRIASLPGLFLATGFSGHGFGIGPGAGKVMANLVTNEDPGYDLSRFRFGRFSDGSKMRPGPAI